MTISKDTPAADLTDDELFAQYRYAKQTDDVPQWWRDDLQLEIADRWEAQHVQNTPSEEIDELRAYLRDHHGESYDHMDDSQDWHEGFAHARFLVRQYQLSWLDGECACDGPPLAEQAADGTWVCGECGAVLARDADPSEIP